MPRETVTIEVSKLQPYEAAAQLLAVVAYPNNKSERSRFANAICGWVLGHSWKDQELANTPIAAPPRYWKAANGADAIVKKGMLVINRKRLIAAKQASPKLEEFRQYATGSQQPGFKAVLPTSEEMLTAISADLNQPKRRETRGRRKHDKDTVADKGNVTTRGWTPSKPVLHLSLAVHLVMHHLSPNQQDLNLGDLLSDTKRIAGIIQFAGFLAPAMQIFGIAPGELIKVIAA